MSSPPSTHVGSEDQQNVEDFTPQAATRGNIRSKMVTIESPKPREKSPKSMLREAKEKLKTVPRSSASREKSPSQMLREAKLKLRKLEIEAEAVERSYIDFRRRRDLRAADAQITNSTRSTNRIDPVSIMHTEERAGQSQSNGNPNDFMKVELDKYLMKYQTNFDIGQTHFKNKNTAAEIKKPIPKDFSENSNELAATLKYDYIEKPLSEFRKLYYTQPVRKPDNLETSKHLEEPDLPHNSEHTLNFCKERRAEVRKLKYDKQKEFEVLQQNISKIYNLQDEPTKEAVETPFKEPNLNMEDKNLLRVEVESTSEINDLKGKSDKNVLLYVQSSVDPTESADSRSMGTQMTIIVSPKSIEPDASKSPVLTPRSEQDRLTRNVVFDPTFDATEKITNEAHLESGIEDSVNEPADYADDFSADVDNYNNKSEDEHGLSSPVSLPKTSDDEVYWD